MALRGGGSRARKAARRMPRTVTALKRARARVSRTPLEQASWQDSAGKIHRYKEKVVAKTIKVAPRKRCAFFVVRAAGNVPAHFKTARYAVASLCHGGQRLTAHDRTTFKTQAAARKHLRKLCPECE